MARSESLTQLAAPEARVIRDGAQQQIAAAGVVRGDLLVLAEGDIVPADARVTEAAALLVDESALTGESVPVDKIPGSGPGRTAGVVSSGTVIVRGHGQAVVTATGTASAMGRVAALMTARSALTPLQHRMIGVGRALARSCCSSA
jgi:Ca2+-transporting ATPase